MRSHLISYLVAGVCLSLMTVQSVKADMAGTANVVSPARADSIVSPITFRTIQTTTEVDSSEYASVSAVRVGIDSYLRKGYSLYDVPVSVTINPDFQAQLNIPAVSTTDHPDSGASGGLQIGDVRLSIRYRTDVDKDYEAFFILTAKFASGDPGNGSGTGSYDFSFTHKSVFRTGEYRTTLMAGITMPPPFDFTVLDNSVVYGPAVAYMAATERSLSNTGLKLGIKAAGLYSFSSRINTESQKNAAVSLDIIPEVTYRISDGGSIRAGVIVPVYTRYDLPGAENRRDPTVNISLSSYF